MGLAACSNTPSAPPSQDTVEVEAPAAATAAPAAEAPQQEAAAASGDVRTYAIDPAQSQARFMIDEVLMGSPKTVVGSTELVAGAVMVDMGNHSLTQIGPIQIDARDLETDDNFRNRAMRRQILASQEDAYQYIVYSPTTLEGLPETVTVGAPFEFSVTGDLKIRDITQPVTFAVTVTPVSETELQGSARATVQRADFDLRIPSVPSVANVSEEVFLEFDFVAVAE
jgi:polyisoprenoid-binding protein YceI